MTRARRRWLWILPLFVLLLPPAGALAEAETEPVIQTTDPAMVEQLHQELRALRATMERALNERDIDTLVAHVDDDVVFTTMNGDVARGPDAIREYFSKMMEGDTPIVNSITTHFKPESLSILHEDDVAVAYGHSEDLYELTSGKRFAIDGRWSATMLRRDGQWKVASFHYSANIFDNPVLAGQRRLLLMAAAVAVLVLGLLAFFVGRGVGRRNAA